MKNKSKYLKKFKYGTIATITVAIVLAIVVILNVFMSMITNKYPIKLDLTQDNRYELCDETINYLKNIDGDIEVAVMLTEEELNAGGYYFTDTYRRIPTEIIPQLLDKYKVYSDGSVTVKYIDMDKQPDEVSKYSSVYNGTISAQNIVIYSNDKVKVLTLSALYSQAQPSAYDIPDANDSGVIFTGESAITTAMMSVTDANPVSAGIINSMNGQAIFSQTSYYSILQLSSTLSSNGYDIYNVDIATDELSVDDYDLLVLTAPEMDFTEEAISKLEDFLYNDADYGKNLIYISSIPTADTPNLDEFLAKWNIQIEDSIIYDDNSQYVSTYSGTANAPIANIVNEELLGNMANNALPIVAPYSRALTVLSKNSDVSTEVILQSSATSYLGNVDGETVDGALNSANNIITVSSRSRAEQFDVFESKVMVVGCVMLTDVNIMTQTSAYNNANFMLNNINSFVGKDSSVVIPQKNLQTVTISIDQNQLSGIRTAVMYIIPGIIVVIGIFVFIRRKNR